MPFLAQEPCVGHAGSSTDSSFSCCSGYTKWFYDANTGQPYTGFMCWTTPCADQGQFAKPAGVAGPGCCPPLVNVGGKCSVAPVINPPPSTPPPPPSSSGGGFFDSLGLDSTTLMMIGGGLLLLLMMGGKKR